MLGDGFVVSIGTEFIENESEDASKNDCEIKAFRRLWERMQKEYRCLPVDSLYASEPVFGRCLHDNHWHILLRDKESSILPIAEEYRSIAEMGRQGNWTGRSCGNIPGKGKCRK